MAVLAGPAVLGGCSQRTEGGRQDAARDAEWAWLQNAERQLTERREHLRAGESAAAAGGSAAALDAESRDVDAMATEVTRRLVVYINGDPPVEGVPLTPRQLAAIRMKSDEEIEVAHEYIARSGDYRRAIEIYQAALAADPRNPRLRDELAQAQASRYLGADRFARAAPGMSADEIRAALGPANAHDIRVYPRRGPEPGEIVAWFYPRNAEGAAAAVWFEQKAGRLVAYRCDWDAIPALTPAPGAGETAAPPR